MEYWQGGVSHLIPPGYTLPEPLLIFFLYRLCLLIIKLVWPAWRLERRQQLCHNKVFTEREREEIILLDEKPGHLPTSPLPAINLDASHWSFSPQVPSPQCVLTI